MPNQPSQDQAALQAAINYADSYRGEIVPDDAVAQAVVTVNTLSRKGEKPLDCTLRILSDHIRNSQAAPGQSGPDKERIAALESENASIKGELGLATDEPNPANGTVYARLNYWKRAATHNANEWQAALDQIEEMKAKSNPELDRLLLILETTKAYAIWGQLNASLNLNKHKPGSPLHERFEGIRSAYSAIYEELSKSI